MSDTLADILQQTSDPAPVAGTNTDTSVTEPTSSTTPEPEVPENVRAYLEKNPDHKSIADVLNREFQSAFTPRLQKAAELQKLVDGVDPNAINTLRQLQQLAETNPEQVAQWYRAQADVLHPNNSAPGNFTPAQLPGTDDPWSGLEPVTDVEAKLLDQVRSMSEWQKRFEASQAQKELTAKGTQVKAERNSLQTEFGVVIPDVELAQIWDVAERGGLSIRQAYIAMQGDTLFAKLVQKARDEASGVVQNKLNLNAGNPAGVPSRSAGTPTVKGSLHDFYSEAVNSK